MDPIQSEAVQKQLTILTDTEVYMHLEMTTGAYAAHFDETKHPASMFVSNASIRYSRGTISGEGPFRIGLKTSNGWVYAEGLTHFEVGENDCLLTAGHDSKGKLVVALQLSRTPFE